MLEEVNKYYLYRHIREDMNEPCYIGIGTKEINANSEKQIYRRAYAVSARNNYWKEIYNITNIQVEILFESNSKDVIFRKEKFFINLYGRIFNNTGILCNVHEGGLIEDFNNIKRHSRCVHQYNLEGRYIKTFLNMREVLKEVKVTNTNIYKSLNSPFGWRSSGGFLWSYVKKDLIEKEEFKDKPNKTQGFKVLIGDKLYRSMSEASIKHFKKSRQFVFRYYTNNGRNDNFEIKGEKVKLV